MSELLGEDSIYNGIQTSANRVYVHRPTKMDETYVYFEKDGETWPVERWLTRPYFKTASGVESLHTYRPFKPNAIVIYPYEAHPDGLRLVSLDAMASDAPKLLAYLRAYESVLDHPKRDIKPTPETGEEWHRYGRHQSLEKCAVPQKIIVGVLSSGDKYAVDVHGTLISSGGTAGYCMITPPADTQYSIYYLQAILNSKYLEWCSALYGEVFRGGFIARGTKVLKRLPIRTLDFSKPADVAHHERIVSLQRGLIDCQRALDEASGNRRASVPLQRRFDRQKQTLDSVLKALYGFDDTLDALIPSIGEMYAAH